MSHLNDMATTHNNRGVKHAVQYQFDQANEHLSQAIRAISGESSPVPYWNAALCELRETGLSERVYQLMTQAEYLGFDSAAHFITAWNHNSAGMNALNEGQYAECIAEFQSAIRWSPFTIALYHWNLGLGLLKMPGRETDGQQQIRIAANCGYVPAKEALTSESGDDVDWDSVVKFAADVAQFFLGG